MSRVVSIEPSEPGLYVVTVLRSETQSLGKILESIAHPPIDEDAASSTARDVDDMLRPGTPGGTPGSQRNNGRRRPARGH